MNFKNLKSSKIFLIFISSLLFCEIFLNYNKKTYAEYKIDNSIEKKRNIPKDRIRNENIRNSIFSDELDTDIGDFLIVKVFGIGAPGNGVLLAHKKNNYFLLTAAHVVRNLSEGMELKIQTIDKKMHQARILKKSSNFDSALLSFKSKNYYYTAHIRSNVRAYKGLDVELVGYSLPSKAVKNFSLRKTFGRVIGVLEENTDGYRILYSNPTNVGMSGGGVFTYPRNSKGLVGHPMNHPCFGFITPTLVAIHGRGEEYMYGGKSGVNLGISIHDLLDEYEFILKNEGIYSFPSEISTRIWKDSCPLYKENAERISEEFRNKAF